MKTFDDYLRQANENILKFNFKNFEDKFIEKLLSKKSLTSLANSIVNIRTEAFKLQSFGRILRRSGDDVFEQVGSSVRDEAKYCEDAMGRFLYSYEMFCEVKPGLKLKSEATSDLLLAYFSFIELVPLIIKKQKRIKELLSKLPADHLILRKLYLKGLKKELKKIRDNINNIDPNKLEDGTHKLRRLIRWVIMHIIYPQGLFTYDNKPVGGPSKFLVLKPVAINKPVILTYAHLAGLSEMVAHLGKSKDELLYHHYEDALHSKSFDINKSDRATIKLTQNIIDNLKSEKWIKKIRKVLKV